MTTEEVRKELGEWRAAKSALDRRVRDARDFYSSVFRLPPEGGIKRSAWLFNSIMNKRAQVCEKTPEIKIEADAEGGTAGARALTRLVRDVFDDNGYEELYSAAATDKLVCGTAVWAVTERGGRIAISRPDILDLVWEPGIRSLSDSSALYVLGAWDEDELRAKYRIADPRLLERTDGGRLLVADRYSFERDADGKKRTVMRKYCGGALLYDGSPDGVGCYAHGRYPILLDTLFEDCSSPAGYGYVDLLRGAQEDIDLLDHYITENIKRASKRRFFVRLGGSVDEREFGRYDRDFIHVASSSLGEDSIRELTTEPLPSQCLAFLEDKISQFKDYSFNRDSAAGGTERGVTSAAAITALQQASYRSTADIIRSGERCAERTAELVCAVALSGKAGGAAAERARRTYRSPVVRAKAIGRPDETQNDRGGEDR